MFFGGLFNSNYGFGMNNWFIPSFSFDFTKIFTGFSQIPVFTPVFNFSSSIWNTTQKNTTTKNYATTQSNNNENNKIYTNNDKTGLKGYDEKAGKKLADIALRDSVGWTGYCARHVKKAIKKANLGSYEHGHAYQMTSILKNNSNFREIPADTVNVKDLPAGCILVYDKGKQGYNKYYGHTEITTGDGRAVSDGITKNLTKKPTAIFVPVKHDYLA